MKRFIWILFLFLFLNSCEKPQKITRILWLGSSSTYVHNLPLQVGNWLNSFSDFDSVETYLTGKSGTGFHEYMRDGFQAQYGLADGQTLLEKIELEKFDYVVLQQISYFIADSDSVEIIKDTKILADAIRAAGGEPVIYEMGWRLEPLNETGRQMSWREAKKNNIKMYAPCSSAWARVRAEQPDIELHNLPDTDHPGTLGTYLNMCCFYAAFTGESPAGLPRTIETWPRFGAFDKEAAREKLKTASLDDYHAAMPQWMQMISVMRWQENIKADVAAYLQKVAWEMVLEKRKEW
jgi:hypothetical protein